MTTRSIASVVGLFAPFRKKRLYLQSRESFYESKNYLTSYGRLSSLIHKSSANTLATEKTIKFYGLEFGVSLKKAIKHLGKPNFAGKGRHLLRKHRVIYYRITIAGVKCLLQLHFLHDQFFLGLIELRSSGNEIKRDVSQLIKRKYGLTDENWTGQIRDNSGNQIELKNDIIPYIVYCWGDYDNKESISLQLDEWQLKKQRYYDKKSDLLLEMI